MKKKSLIIQFWKKKKYILPVNRCNYINISQAFLKCYHCSHYQKAIFIVLTWLLYKPGVILSPNIYPFGVIQLDSTSAKYHSYIYIIYIYI